MNFEEHAAKPVLAAAGIETPAGRMAATPEEAGAIAAELGPVMIKAQVPTGKRGKAGGIKAADDATAARDCAAAILGMDLDGHPVERVLVEARMPVARELYAAVLNDPASGGPLLVFSAEGGMDIEAVAARDDGALRTLAVDIGEGVSRREVGTVLRGLGLDKPTTAAVSEALVALYRAYLAADAELLEINPLALLGDGRVVALDCKLVMDDSAVKRQAELAARGSPEPRSELESRGDGLNLKYIELDGDVGVLANGAGLTMTTMDMIAHYGGRPANFLEIGGDAYTRGRQATELVLANPRLKSLVVNFCGAFARTDVMTRGVIEAWEQDLPEIPVFFAIRGTGSESAVRLLSQRLSIAPHETMDQAVDAAVKAAAGVVAGAGGGGLR